MHNYHAFKVIVGDDAKGASYHPQKNNNSDVGRSRVQINALVSLL